MPTFIVSISPEKFRKLRLLELDRIVPTVEDAGELGVDLILKMYEEELKEIDARQKGN